MLTGLTAKLALIQFAIIACILGLSYWYYTSSQNTIKQLTQNNSKLQTAVQLQEQTIEAQTNAAIRQNTAMFELQQNLSGAELQKRQLETRLRSVDLQATARANAMGLEIKINESTANIFKNIENITASKNRTNNVAILPEESPVATSNSLPQQSTNNPQPPPRPPQRSGVMK